MLDHGSFPWDAQGVLSAYTPQSRYFPFYLPCSPPSIHFSQNSIQLQGAFSFINYNSALYHSLGTNPFTSKQKSKGQYRTWVRILQANDMLYITVEHFILRDGQKVNSTAEKHEGKEHYQAGGEGHMLRGALNTWSLSRSQ